MTPERVRAVLQQLAQAGAISKSAYAQLCGVGPATASKHLAELVRRGLIVQVGRSRTTRYVLS
jgi:DNA-binding IclR family transcriptional regulator